MSTCWRSLPLSRTLRQAWCRTSNSSTSLPHHHQTRLITPLSTPLDSSKWPRLRWRRTVFQRAQQQRTYARQTYQYSRFANTQSLFRRWAARPTFYYEVGGIGVACGGFYVYNLEPVPVSGRLRFNLVSPEREAEMGEKLFQETLQQYGPRIMSANSREHRMVEGVLNRLIPFSGLSDSKWEVRVINTPELNAFVIPGGKVFVFRGILDLCQGEDGLAAVLGHEIAHNVAHHSAERMSQNFILLGAAMLGSLLIGLDIGVGKLLTDLAFTLPGSRAQESEADYIGLLMMAEACYNPEAALGLWARMEKAQQGQQPPQFLSTHPSNHDRGELIRTWLPEADDKRVQGQCAETSQYANDFRRALGISSWR